MACHFEGYKQCLVGFTAVRPRGKLLTLVSHEVNQRTSDSGVLVLKPTASAEETSLRKDKQIYGRRLMWDSPLCVMNMFYYHWLIKKQLQAIAGQNIDMRESRRSQGDVI